MLVMCSRCRKKRPEALICVLSGRKVCKKCAEEAQGRNFGRGPVYYPTAEEIAAAGKKIRDANTEGMTEEQIENHLRKRAGVEREPYTIDEVHGSSPKFLDWVSEGRVGRRGGY